jgi:phosphate-selective porin OprO/OprP
VAENVNYSIEMDFATAGRPSFMDVWGEVTKVPWFENVRLGHFRQPFSMEAMTSVRQLQFLERSLAFQALVPFRRLGLMAYDHSADERTTWAYSVYRTAAFGDVPLGDTRFATNLTDAGDYSFSTRLTHLLWYDEPSDGRYLLHIGGGYNYSVLTENPTTGGKFYRASAIPEFFVGDPTAPGNATALRTPNFVDTGLIPAEDYHLFGTELAACSGPVYLQSEYMQAIVNQIGGPTLDFEGVYVQAGWFLTGEHRPYNRPQGVFDRVRPFEDFFSFDGQCCGSGAWELVLRWSYVDLNSENVAGGKLNDLTAGLTWYLNPWCRLQFNYIRAMADGLGPAAGNTDIYAARWQVDF